eukprot:3349768-Rhodomonas_salina.2
MHTRVPRYNPGTCTGVPGYRYPGTRALARVPGTLHLCWYPFCCTRENAGLVCSGFMFKFNCLRLTPDGSNHARNSCPPSNSNSYPGTPNLRVGPSPSQRFE